MFLTAAGLLAAKALGIGLLAGGASVYGFNKLSDKKVKEAVAEVPKEEAK